MREDPPSEAGSIEANDVPVPRAVGRARNQSETKVGAAIAERALGFPCARVSLKAALEQSARQDEDVIDYEELEAND